MAFTYANSRHPETFSDSVSIYGLEAVGGTARIKSTVRTEKDTDGQLVYAY